MQVLDIRLLFRLYAVTVGARWLGFFADFFLHESSPASALLSHIGRAATTSFVLMVLCVDWRADVFARRCLPLVAAAELAYGVVEASKSPILILVLAFYLDPRRKRLSVKQGVASLVLAAFAFSFVQSLKPQAVDEVAGGNLITTVGREVTARFDALRALTGAYQNGPGSLGDASSLAATSVRNLLPQSISGERKQLAAVVWGKKIYHLNYEASFAEGLTAEGYASEGLPGVVIWNVLGGLIVVVVSRVIISRRLVAKAFAGTILSSTVIFERGLLGFVEVTGDALQVSLVFFVLQYLLATKKTRIETQPRWQVPNSRDDRGQVTEVR